MSVILATEMKVYLEINSYAQQAVYYQLGERFMFIEHVFGSLRICSYDTRVTLAASPVIWLGQRQPLGK